MPYMRQGGLKISDHHVNSPLLKINRSCQTCHHFPEEELKARVEDIQDTFFNLRNNALDALVDLINDIKAQKAKGATDAQLADARNYQRKENRIRATFTYVEGRGHFDLDPAGGKPVHGSLLEQIFGEMAAIARQQQ